MDSYGLSHFSEILGIYGLEYRTRRFLLYHLLNPFRLGLARYYIILSYSPFKHNIFIGVRHRGPMSGIDEKKNFFVVVYLAPSFVFYLSFVAVEKKGA